MSPTAISAEAALSYVLVIPMLNDESLRSDMPPTSLGLQTLSFLTKPNDPLAEGRRRTQVNDLLCYFSEFLCRFRSFVTGFTHVFCHDYFFLYNVNLERTFACVRFSSLLLSFSVTRLRSTDRGANAIPLSDFFLDLDLYLFFDMPKYTNYSDSGLLGTGLPVIGSNK